jgi:hypothetical protein
MRHEDVNKILKSLVTQRVKYSEPDTDIYWAKSKYYLYAQDNEMEEKQ